MNAYVRIIPRKIISFQLSGEPEMVHFIKSGFTLPNGNSLYHVIEEDAYEIKPDGTDYLLDKEIILKKFGIDIEEEYNSNKEIHFGFNIERFKEDL
jgi:hypothetical protein